MFYLGSDFVFPPCEMADKDGLLAVGGDLHPERVYLAYRNGIFPWNNVDDPTMWWSPDPRFVLFPQKLKISKTIKALIKKAPFRVSMNEAFEEVLRHCANTPRKGQEGTWLHEELIQTMCTLHHKGIAVSVECWQGNSLVGGLYGLLLDRVFCGESMFSLVPNASRYAFIYFVQHLLPARIQLIDCQIHSDYLESLGAEFVSRKFFLSYLS